MTLSLPGLATGSAVFSPCGRYRYRLSREFGAGAGRALFVCCNPSTASAEQDDPTVRRMIDFARRWGFAALDVGNIFAFRSTDPRALYELDDPVGPENDAHLRELARGAGRVVVAWGNHGALRGRGDAVRRLLREAGARPLCFRITGAGEPEHPLYQRADAVLVEAP